MTKATWIVAVVCLFGGVPHAEAQEPYNLTASVKSLATLLTDLYGPKGLIVDSEATLPGEQPHTAHFTSDFQTNFSQFSTALVSQIVSVPLPSPASSFTYHFDPTLGVFQRTTQSFGPILAERADTIGASRFSFGFAYQRFTFDSVEGLDLQKVPAVFTHDNAFLLGGRQDVVTTTNAITTDVSQSTTFVTMGITDRIDISLAVPFVSTYMKVVSDASIQRLGTTNPLTHFFRQSDGSIGDRRLFTAIGSASGIGDLTIRMKGLVARPRSSAVAVGLDVQLPTGDEMNLLGTGTAGLQPFVIWSAAVPKISPHLNASCKGTGSSVLAGTPAAGESGDFPDQVGYAAGADISINPRITFAADLLGRYIIRTERLRLEQFHALDGKSVFPNIVFSRDSFNAMSGSFGLKTNVLQRLLVDVNVLFNLDEHGVRDKVTPLIGIEYAF